MPTYTFRDKETGVVFDKFMLIKEKQDYLTSNPSLEPLINYTVPIGDSVRLGLKTTDSGFKEVLHRIAEKNYKSNLKDKLSRN